MKTISEHLAEEEITPLHARLIQMVRNSARASRAEMNKYKPVWDAAHEAYERKIDVSPKDVEAKSRGLPAKLVTPLTYTQINTAIAWCFLMLKQKELLFDFKGSEGQDEIIAPYVNTLVNRDLQKSQGDQVVMEYLRNIMRFGIGILTEAWTEDVVHVPVDEVIQPPIVLGVPTGSPSQITNFKPVVKFQGNKVRNISPYKFLPDPSVHITKWKDGAFVAFEAEYSKGELQKLESSKKAFGVGFVKTYNASDWSMYGRSANERTLTVKPDQPECNSFLITEYYAELIPDQVKGDDAGDTLGKESVPIMYLIWLANDQRIVRCEPLNALHCEYPISVGFFSPDEHTKNISSMATIGEDLQKIHSWLINSRIGAVTRTIDGQVVASPLMVDMNTIEQRHRIIRTTKAGAQRPIDSFFKPLNITDTTVGHFQDLSVIKDAIQSVTGVNDNMMGIASGGRRPATEMRNVMSGSSSRMKLILNIIWASAFVPMANRMRTNLRQAISQEQFIAACGQKAAEHFPLFRSDPVKLASEYDFLVLDGTSPSEKAFTAQQLQDILSMLLSVPTAALTFGLNAKKLFYKICELRGLGDMSNLELTPEEMKQMLLQMQAQTAVTTPAKPTPTNSPQQ